MYRYIMFIEICRMLDLYRNGNVLEVNLSVAIGNSQVGLYLAHMQISLTPFEWSVLHCWYKGRLVAATSEENHIDCWTLISKYGLHPSLFVIYLVVILLLIFKNYLHPQIKVRRLQGLMILVFVKQSILPYISSIESETTKTGFGGFWVSFHGFNNIKYLLMSREFNCNMMFSKT